MTMQTLGAGDPHRIGPYVVTGRLGAGGMGSVYLGWDPAGRPAAVKVVRTDFLQDPDFRARFRREISSARRVSGPWISRVLDADPDAESPWLATEYVPGPTLDTAVNRFGPLPTETVAVLAECLGQALSAVHQAGVVHRDIKPNNILLAADGPRLIDFGIARATDDTKLTATHAGVLGVAGFIAPERIERQAMLPAGDVFAGGVVLAYAATGKMAFGSGEPVTVAYRVVHAEPDLSELPEELRPLVTRCLAKDPAERPDAAELASAGARLRGATDWPGVPITNDGNGSSPTGDTLQLATSWLPRPLAMHTVRDYDLTSAHAAAETARLDVGRPAAFGGAGTPVPGATPTPGAVAGFGADIGPGATAHANGLTGNALNAAGFGDMSGRSVVGGAQGGYGPQGPNGPHSPMPPRLRTRDTEQLPPKRKKPVALMGLGAAVVVAGLIAGGVALASGGGTSTPTASQGNTSGQAAGQSTSGKDGGDLSSGSSKPGDALPSGVPVAGGDTGASVTGAGAAPGASGSTSAGAGATSGAGHSSAASSPSTSAAAHSSSQAAPPPSSKSNPVPPPSTSQGPAPSPVPCGGTAPAPAPEGAINCPFDTPGDGSSSGAPVRDSGGNRVGYLPSGTNWVVCQAQGRTETQGQYYNNWWAWTEADNRSWGWVNAVDAHGGDNNGAFGSVPMCNGQHGSPPQ